MNGKVYGLDMHLDRFLISATKAQIHHSYSKDEIEEVVLKTIAASETEHGCVVRMYLTAGRGDYSIFSEQLERFI